MRGTVRQITFANGGRLFGRADGAGAGDGTELTPTQATAILNTFTATLKGLVPAPTTATGKVLSDNGTWVIPSSGGIDAATIAFLTGAF